MTLNKKFVFGERSNYETPLVKTLDILSEGVLCGSFTANTIDDAHEDDWGTL